MKNLFHFLFHKWSKWEIIQGGRWICQKRTCSECGKTQLNAHSTIFKEG